MRRSACSAKGNANAQCCWSPLRRAFVCCVVILSTVALPQAPSSEGTLAMAEAHCPWTTYSVLRKAWQGYCKQAGVQATIHQLRHSRATQLIQAGVPITTIRKQLGHRNLQSTLLYAEVDQATVKHDLLEYQRRK